MLTVYATSTGTGDPLSRDGRLLATTLSHAAAAVPGLAGPVTLYLDSTALDDLYLAVTWGAIP